MSYFTPNPVIILNYPEGTEAAIVRVSDSINKIIHKDGAVYIKDYIRFNLSDDDYSDNEPEEEEDDISCDGMDYDMKAGERRKDLDLNSYELDEILNKLRIESLSEKLRIKLMQI